MDAPKHTGGTWRASDTAKGARFGAVVSDEPVEGGEHDAGAIAYYGGHLIAESIVDCNRPIIAAAPALYAALGELVEASDAYGETEDEVSAQRCLTAVEKAREALALARSEQP